MIGILWLFLQSAASHLLYLALRLETGSFPKPLSAKEEQAAFAAMRAGDAAARETLICHNLRLVAHIVKKYYTVSGGQDDFISIGTIGLTAADHAKQVVGVEVNREAVHDAIGNAKHNGVKNARFFAADATRWIREAAAAGEKADVIFMDPPREGSTPEFLASVARMAPKRVVYVSCNPVTLARDLATLTKLGYKAEGFTPVDMFPHTEHIETVCALSKLEIHRKKPSGKR